MNVDELIAFEDDIAADFNAGKIPYPVHLAGGNESNLIQFFSDHIKEEDYIAVAWRSHYHCLLKGVPPAELKAAIMAGRSIALCFPDHKIISSAIVGGVAPIAMGIAWAIKRRQGTEKVWCFLGDMTMTSGIVAETIRYAHGHDLPIHFVLEDNGRSVCAPTSEVWGRAGTAPIWSYRYALTRPHVGTGQFVRF